MINLIDTLIVQRLKAIEIDKNKLLVIIVFSVLIVYSDVAFLMKMQMAGIQTVQPKIAELNSKLSRLKKDLSTIKDLERKQSQMKHGKLSEKRIIAEDKISLLLQTVSGIANKNNVRIMQIKPSKESKPKPDGVLKDASKFTIFYISLDLTSSYHDLGRFINDLENADEYISVQDIKISRDPGQYSRQIVNVTLKTYAKK